FERVFDRDQAVVRAVAPTHVHVLADVREEHDVDVLEGAGADVVGLRADEFLGDAGPEADGPRQMLLFHDLLHGQRRRDLQRHPRVVAFAVAGRAVDHRLVIRDAGLLRRLWNAVDVGPERNHRLTGSPARHEGGRDAGQVLLNREAVLPQDVGQVLRNLKFLEPELGKTDHLVVYARDVFAHAVHFQSDVALVLLGGWIRRRRRRLLRRLLRLRLGPARAGPHVPKDSYQCGRDHHRERSTTHDSSVSYYLPYLPHLPSLPYLPCGDGVVLTMGYLIPS